MANRVEQYLRSEQQLRYIAPHQFVEDDKDAVYNRGEVIVGWPVGADRIFDDISRDYTVAVIGAQLGDEGKGRIVDNKLDALLGMGITRAWVVRYGGGSNAGHTIYTEDNQKLSNHQLPSSVAHPQAIGVMDSGMVIHMEDLQTEIMDAEAIVGDLKEKLMLSEEAILVSDLDRAMEVLNREITSGRSDGGTGRGMSMGYSNHLSRRGMEVKELMAENWRDEFEKRYDDHVKTFADKGKDLSKMEVPDFRETRKQGKEVKRFVGTKQEFLDRLEEVRAWYLAREAQVPHEKRMIQNTFLIHQDLLHDMTQGILFEGAQAVGLDAWLGRRPDVASSSTTASGISTGTKFWDHTRVEDRIGIFKISYMSSVGSAYMITDYGLPREKTEDIPQHVIDAMTPEQKYAFWIRNEAHEFGTTSGRPRDICRLDLDMMRYNIKMGGIEVLAGTHLDIAQEGVDIEVCTHYTDADGNRVAYQPGIVHQQGLTPHYEILPGWDGKKVAEATSFEKLPDNAKKFLAFIQRQTGIPIVFVTKGKERKNNMPIPEVKLAQAELFRPRHEAKRIGMKIQKKKGTVWKKASTA